MRKILSVMAVLGLWAGNAHALAITNLDKTSHTVHITTLGEPSDVSIAPGNTYRTWGYGYVLRLDNDTGEIRSADNNDFVIWPPGRLSIQTYRTQRNSSFTRSFRQ
jgi:hypothetical protein